MPIIEPAHSFLRGCRCCAGPHGISRRGLFAGAAALSAIAATHAVAQPATTPTAQTPPHRIDVHHHVAPPVWVSSLKSVKMDSPPVNNWTPERSLAEMDRGGIATSILSVTQPALSYLGPKDGASMARACNEYAKSLTVAHPGRFGMFAVLPMPHVDETLAEIAYALDVLKADGVAFMTSYGNNWLGAKAFEPVMDELHRRKAVAYTHPNTPDCCVNLVGLPGTAIEYGTDTTRTIANLIFSGASARSKDIKFIFSHAGGTVTAITERLSVQMVATPEYKAFTGPGVMAELKRFYYDTAQASNPIAMGSLTRMVATEQILFGTDYPYRTAPEQVRGLQEVFGPEALKLIERGNAQRLLPRWA